MSDHQYPEVSPSPINLQEGQLKVLYKCYDPISMTIDDLKSNQNSALYSSTPDVISLAFTNPSFIEFYIGPKTQMTLSGTGPTVTDLFGKKIIIPNSSKAKTYMIQNGSANTLRLSCKKFSTMDHDPLFDTLKTIMINNYSPGNATYKETFSGNINNVFTEHFDDNIVQGLCHNTCTKLTMNNILLFVIILLLLYIILLRTDITGL
jgi:hypothetical protein